jgi:hypothetical protein
MKKRIYSIFYHNPNNPNNPVSPLKLSPNNPQNKPTQGLERIDSILARSIKTSQSDISEAEGGAL